MRLRPLLLAVAIAVLALVAGGCGGNGTRLTKAEFITQANAICAKWEKRVQSQMAGITTGDEKQLASSIEKVLPTIRKGNDELRSLKPPQGLQSQFDRWMQIADAEVDAAQKLQDALQQKDRQAIQTTFKELQSKDEAQDRLARQELGLTGCASGSSG
jgi:hypothetical protein